MRENELLARLPREVQVRLEAEVIDVSRGQALWEARQPIEFAFFPYGRSVVSLLAHVDDATVEIAMVGKEGLAGFAPMLGVKQSPARAVMQADGRGARVVMGKARAEFGRHGEFYEAVMRYMAMQMNTLQIVSGCNRHHDLDSRLARWLLSAALWRGGSVVEMTQYQIADCIGVRREGVTASMQALINARIIATSRGRIVIQQPEKLEARSCECYALIAKELDHYQGAK